MLKDYGQHFKKGNLYEYKNDKSCSHIFLCSGDYSERIETIHLDGIFAFPCCSNCKYEDAGIDSMCEGCREFDYMYDMNFHLWEWDGGRK